MPNKKVSSTQDWGRLLGKPVPAKDKSPDKKVQTKGKRRTKGNQAEVANQEIKPGENGETRMKRVQLLMKQEKEAKSN
ncbi:unnamed protein product [Nyctereutes procyonoides]|uniref:(raccoon dog) hypothetical protein n=1 Tax=Nyctereutes procyonoides TaxID=34880 RepID=A0A811YWJ0_NYCPR|nr:unnamed protein product [Nyctereutes procyonoides]